MVFRPVGSLSPAVYWRRRALVAVVLIAALVLLWTLFTGGGNGSDRHPTADGTHHASVTPSRTPATITPSPGAGGPPAPPDGDGADASRSAGGSGDSGGSGGPSGSGGSGSGTVSGVDAGTPPTCPDAALRLTVDTDRTQYQPGDHPMIRLTLTNTSAVACSRDVGAAQQEALVYAGRVSGPDRFWSSNDCDPGGDPDVRTIDVGVSLHFSVTWAAVSSQPNCTGTSTPAAPGDYSVVARVGSLRSDPARITLG